MNEINDKIEKTFGLLMNSEANTETIEQKDEESNDIKNVNTLSQLTVEKELGKGAFGTVYLVSYNGE